MVIVLQSPETKNEMGRIKNMERQRKKEEDMMEMVERKAI
jgi:hypothetical protein